MGKFLRFTIILVMATMSLVAWAQNRTVSGKVSDKANGSPIPGVNVTFTLNGSKGGTTTDDSGNFTLSVPNGVSTLRFSSVGYISQDLAVSSNMNVQLAEEVNELKEVVIAVGSRAVQRTYTDTPLPVDNLTAKEITASGQVTFDKALQYRVPSFNSNNLPVQDATSLLDPYELRNLGPSRTLILINGKRKNMSSLVYVQNTVGKGETGADLAAIPTGAIKRVEILRDGASAQYGSDAMAGVMNIILKDRVEYTEATLQSGIYTKGDGLMFGTNINTGSSFDNGGFVNYNLAFKQQNRTNRSGDLDPKAEINTLTGKTPQDSIDVYNFLSKYPDGKNINGIPEITSANFGVNAGINVGEKSQVYGNAAYVFKRVFSYANYRTPYWRQDPYFLLHQPGEEYLGYHPTFDGNLNDYNATVGYKTESESGWKVDVSATTGGNGQLYYVNGTLNRGLGAASPTSFRPGGYKFKHNVGNIDLSKALSDKVSLGLGTEIRNETYEIIAGDTASYKSEGANSFPGIRDENAGVFTRFNYGGYADLGFDFTKDFFLGLTARAEKYSDFGNAFVWKASTRYKIQDFATIRASASTGFRAPSLHQINLQVSQATFSGGNIVLEGILNNNNPTVRKLGVPKLKAEKSLNLTAGVGLNPTDRLSITIDYYRIAIDDRIVLSSRISSDADDDTSALYNALTSSGVSAVSFFINGINTVSQGVDFVASYRKMRLGTGHLNANLAFNYNVNEQDGEANTPQIIADAGASIFNNVEKALVLTARPKYKGILGLDYQINRLNIGVNNTLFGPATFRNADLPAGSYLTFDPKVLTDLVLGYEFSEKLGLSLSVNNIANVIPSYKLFDLPADKTDAQVRNDISFNGRYWQAGYDSSHFDINGTNILARLTLKL
ncbi:MAG: TonB-dependent receptor [Chitinophagales bacterium]|nr:TonB-dependent receptor [Chitinophagales bacterium]